MPCPAIHTPAPLPAVSANIAVIRLAEMSNAKQKPLAPDIVS